MGRPINKRFFGTPTAGGNEIKVDFHNGTAVKEGYIVKQKGSKKFVFTEKFISYADVEIYAESEEHARLQFQNGNYQYYDVSDFTDGHELIEVKEVDIDG